MNLRELGEEITDIGKGNWGVSSPDRKYTRLELYGDNTII
jgi:hypothetical protein